MTAGWWASGPRTVDRPNLRALAMIGVMVLITCWRWSFDRWVAVVFLWPSLLLVSFIPGASLGNGYEGTPFHLAAAVIGLPFTLAYWGFVLLQLGRWMKGRGQSQDLSLRRASER